MLKSIITIATAAAVAALIVFATALPPNATPSEVSATSGQIPVLPKGTACSARGWPNFEQSCQFDFRNPANEARHIRVIALR